MQVYNTLSGQKEKLALPKGRALRFFVCGPTVYDYIHLGNARTYVVFDAIVRYLRSRKIKVFYLQNITDVDDKIIDRAREENKTHDQIAKTYAQAYHQDMKKLGITTVNKYISASECIPAIKKQIAKLIKKGYAYQTKSGVYFEVRKFPKYGSLSRQDIDNLRPGWRIELDPEKKDPIDFALWKVKKFDYEPSWSSPWGVGRPGWHIEDTTIAEKVFKTLQYDLHGGGIGLKFPHHEAEIALAESISGKSPYVKIWMHAGLISFDGEKMAKSVGNIITARDFLSKNPPVLLRLAFLRNHYRSPIDYDGGLVLQASHTFSALVEFMSKLILVKKTGSVGSFVKERVTSAQQEFIEKMDDDFNTPEALGSIFKFIGSFQTQLAELNKKEAALIIRFIQQQFATLGIELKSPILAPEIRAIIAKREEARARRDFSKADRLRKKIDALGYIVEDTPLGPIAWEKLFK